MSLEKKRSRVEELRRELEQAERDLNRSETLRRAEPGPGTKLYITAQFPGSDRVYEYLAIRPEGTRPGTDSWYITGRSGKSTWDQLLSRIERADIEIFHMFF